MAGTVSRIIDRIKEVRSGGNPVVALTVETRLVLQGFDPERFDGHTADDPGQLARLQAIAREMNVDVDDLLAGADVEPDSGSEPAPPPKPPRTTARTESVGQESSVDDATSREFNGSASSTDGSA